MFIKKENALKMALSMYENEPCRVCGEIITDVSKAVYAGYAKGNKTRAAHNSCWKSNIPKEQWVYSEDD